jgi:hypothetical protein
MIKVIHLSKTSVLTRATRRDVPEEAFFSRKDVCCIFGGSLSLDVVCPVWSYFVVPSRHMSRGYLELGNGLSLILPDQFKFKSNRSLNTSRNNNILTVKIEIAVF